jgi:hypothetical protein
MNRTTSHPDAFADARRLGDLETRLMFARSAMVEASKCLASGQTDLAIALLASGARCSKVPQ